MAVPVSSASPSAGRVATGVDLVASALLCLGLAAPAQALTIDVTYDSSVTGLGSGGSVTTADIENAYNAVATAFDNAITNNVTISIGVGWGEANGYSVTPGDVSTSRDTIIGSYTYSRVQSLLRSTGATLPSANPAGSALYYIPDAEAVALGLSVTPAVSNTSACHCDGYIGFDSSVKFTFGPSSTIAAGTYDFVAAAEHETEEVLGRISALPYGTSFAYPLDIFRYTAAGTNSFSTNASAYASTDGGVTDLGTFNNPANGGDPGGWAVPNPDSNTDAQDVEEPTGTFLGLSLSDEALLQGLGWDFVSNPAPLFSSAYAPIGATAEVPTNTPEPAGLPALFLGLGAIGVARRRRGTLSACQRD